MNVWRARSIIHPPHRPTSTNSRHHTAAPCPSASISLNKRRLLHDLARRLHHRRSGVHLKTLPLPPAKKSRFSEKLCQKLFPRATEKKRFKPYPTRVACFLLSCQFSEAKTSNFVRTQDTLPAQVNLLLSHMLSLEGGAWAAAHTQEEGLRSKFDRRRTPR